MWLFISDRNLLFKVTISHESSRLDYPNLICYQEGRQNYLDAILSTENKAMVAHFEKLKSLI